MPSASASRCASGVEVLCKPASQDPPGKRTHASTPTSPGLWIPLEVPGVVIGVPQTAGQASRLVPLRHPPISLEVILPPKLAYRVALLIQSGHYQCGYRTELTVDVRPLSSAGITAAFFLLSFGRRGDQFGEGARYPPTGRRQDDMSMNSTANLHRGQ